MPEKESTYAEEGTLAHELAALLLLAGIGVFRDQQGTFNGLLYKITANPLYNNEMLKHCEAYAAYVLDKGGEVLVEHAYDLTKYIPLAFGTADATNLSRGVIHVTDFKYGAGVHVGATGNTQLMCYGLGAYEAAVKKGFKPETVSLSIFQPRVGGPSSWDISVSDLLKWAEEVKPKAALAIAGQGDFVTGEHCRFCKARTVCRACYTKFSEFQKIAESCNEREMTVEERARVLLTSTDITKWITAVVDDSIARMTRGEDIPGFKLVKGKGRRAFTNENDVIETLLHAGYESDQFIESKLSSLTAVEKILGKKRFSELLNNYVTNKEGSPQIAPVTDTRPDIGTTAAADYD